MKIEITQPMAVYELGSRKNQEDNMYPTFGTATAADNCFIVCDGMGGHADGEVASFIVSDTVGRYISKMHPGQGRFSKDDLDIALNRAYDMLEENDTGALNKMGTTFTFLKLTDKGIAIAHIGDSRIYHFKISDREVYRTTDHSVVQELCDKGEITEEQMMTDPRRNLITRVMCPFEKQRDMGDFELIEDVKPGDYFMLCSDGMTEKHNGIEFLPVLSDETMTEEEKLVTLKEMTEYNLDNRSAILIKIKSVTA